ncbi:hypothetical protein DH2020_033635 [Rehmannia glutinosa]|uniref:Uncharacterized protein n=1 Tax=Rehmannia glutinosa TaxID=99300 RepID=A0ABR0VC66_REHGL
MESHYFGYGVTCPDFPYSSYSTIPPNLFGYSKFDSRNSPDSPLSTYFDTETLARYDYSQDQNSSTDNNLSEATPSSNYLHQSVPSPIHLLEDTSLLIHPGRPPFLQNVNDNQHMKQALQELESALMAADDDSWLGSSSGEIHVEKRRRLMEDFVTSNIPPYSLKQLLIACARALSENKSHEFEKLIEHARSAVSITGDPIQRLGAYMVEGLIARKESSGTNIYRALNCNEPDIKDLLSYMHTLYEICPYFKFGYMAANGAIAEACKNEDRIHIIDFQIAQGTQWTILLQALAARPGGPPHVRITGIDDPVSELIRGDGLEKRFMLHHTPDESVDVSNPRDELLRMVKSLSPKVVTLVEQESNTNTAPFVQRFVETLDYYSAMFESIDVTMPRDSKDRVNVEKQCLARDVVNVIACEGRERIERHELFGKWRLRFMMAGFRQFPLSSYVNSVIRGLLGCYSEHYTLVEKDGAMLLGWKDRNLISASAWH